MPQIPVYPILATQGVNEMQSVANASGAAAESMQVPPRPSPCFVHVSRLPVLRVAVLNMYFLSRVFNCLVFLWL